MAGKIFEIGDILPTWIKIHFDTSKHLYKPIYFEPIVGSEPPVYGILVSFGTPGDLIISAILNPNQPWVDDTNFIYIFANGITYKLYDLTTNTWLMESVVLDLSEYNTSQRTVSNVLGNSIVLDFLNSITWEETNEPSRYTIIFETNGGNEIEVLENIYQLPDDLPTPTKAGYKFVAWYYESNFQTRAKAGDTIEANTTLYAKWHNLGSLFTEIADAIRSKDGTSENIRDVDFGERVKQIQGAIELTQAQYDALGTKDANTYYLIVEVE